MPGTSSIDAPCTPDNETTQPVVWFMVTATTTSFTINNQQAYTGAGITGTSPQNIKDFVVFSGTPGNLTQIGCATLDATGGPSGQLTVTGLVPGQVYYVMASPSAGALTSTQISPCVTASVAYSNNANITCATATPISFQQGIIISGAGAGPGSSPAFCSASIENPVWYQWCVPSTFPAGQTVYFNICGSGSAGNSLLCTSPTGGGVQAAVWSTGSTCPTASTQTLICQNPGAGAGGNVPINLQFTPVPGQCYYITIDGYAGNTCAFAAGLSTTPGDCNPCIPPVISGPTAICTGETLSLSGASNQANATYTWTLPGGTTQISQNLTIPNATSAINGTYSLTSSSPSCASAFTSTVNVVVNTPPAPPTVSDTSVCGPVAATLMASGSASNTYIWSANPTGTPVLATAGSYTTPVLTAGTYTYYVQNLNAGCPPSTPPTPLVLTVLQTPEITITPPNPAICSGQFINLTASSSLPGQHT
ncbi:MAG: hypothetical protein EOP51_28835, partial [Sphingobacteriales bacterium]